MGRHNKGLRETLASSLASSDTWMGGWFWKIINGWDFRITLVVSVIVAVFGDEWGIRATGSTAGSAMASVGTAILGVVLAGLAILVVFLDEGYIDLLQKVGLGITADLWPFKWTALVAAICAVSGVVLALMGSAENILALRIVLGVAFWSFTYLMWNMWYLVSFVIGHAHTRIKHIERTREANANQPPPSGTPPPAD